MVVVFLEFISLNLNKRMRLKLVEGCVCDSMTIDGKEEFNLTDTERQQVVDRIAEWIRQRPEDLNDLLQDLIPRYGEYYSDHKPCECCGDIVTTYFWDI